MSDSATLPETIVTTKPREHEATKPRLLPPYQVILENDDYHTFAFVIDVLCKVLGCAVERAWQLANLAHNTGQAVVWAGSKEVAELKVDQIRSFHEIHPENGSRLGPLGCRIEPAPG